MGQEAKKRYPVQPPPDKPLDAPVLLQRYEAVREQVLLGEKCGDPPDPDRLVIEQAGLAVWIETVPSTLPTAILRSTFRTEEPWQKEFVSRLADLVVGQRREVKDE